MSQEPTSWRNTPYDPDRIPLDHFYLPAMPPLGAMRAVAEWWRAGRRRRAFRELLKLDDHILRDIGYQRDAIVACSRLPLSVDAAAELVRRTRDTRGDGEGRPSHGTHGRQARGPGGAAPCPDERRHATESPRDPRLGTVTGSTAARVHSPTSPAPRHRPPARPGCG